MGPCRAGELRGFRPKARVSRQCDNKARGSLLLKEASLYVHQADRPSILRRTLQKQTSRTGLPSGRLSCGRTGKPTLRERPRNALLRHRSRLQTSLEENGMGSGEGEENLFSRKGSPPLPHSSSTSQTASPDSSGEARGLRERWFQDDRRGRGRRSWPG